MHLQIHTTRNIHTRRWPAVLLVAGLCLHAACSSGSDAPLFTLLAPEDTGVSFVNTVVEREGFNVLEYEYFYNGAGVAAGDINNDGLPDLYFVANMSPDRLYLNMGHLEFRDITQEAGIRHEPSWHTGVTMVDINDDGWLDVYVGRSGNVASHRRRNLLYVNNRDGTFSEQAAAYGLDDAAYTTHATFLDYDRDGDLDVFLLNHSIRRFSNFLVEFVRMQRDSLAGDKLLRNDGGYFTDVSQQAGIISNPIGFGLSVVTSDINMDGWPDLYVSNDYIEDDYLYISQQDGTFAESIRQYLGHTSYSSMGADIADINRDGRPDIVTLDMLAEGNYRQKILKGPEDHRFYAQFRADGFHEQYMRNMLHVSTGEDYLEVGQLVGISNTDWSWAALFADFNLDGSDDLLVTNGYLRDYTNLDFLKTTLHEAQERARRDEGSVSTLELIRQMPSTPVSNYIFQGGSSLQFVDRTEAWGLGRPTFSSGAAYADLDNDGDFDIIISNTNEPVHIYRNNAQGQSLVVRLQGPPGNRYGVGAKVQVTADGESWYRELVPVRGYLSSVEPRLIFATGEVEDVAVTVTWPDGLRQLMPAIAMGENLTVAYELAEPVAPMKEDARPAKMFVPDLGTGLTFHHRENAFMDFDRDPLLPQMYSREGPALAVGDINQDGLEDVFAGGARGQASQLFLQQVDGTFMAITLQILHEHRDYEDVDALFFDADGDLDLDLYVVSGGSSAPDEDALYQDRLYINAGYGRLEHDPAALPQMYTSTSTVAAHDFDVDGDLDLFVGGRVRTGQFPRPPRSYVLRNSSGAFVDITAEAAPSLLRPGMVIDAIWVDLTGDAARELVIAGEWMPIRVFAVSDTGKFEEITEELALDWTHGFWNALAAADLDRDGDLDLIAGNRGLNTQLRLSLEAPAFLHAADFDRNGTVDPLMSAVVGQERVLVHWRDELVMQLPSMARRFPTHATYAAATFGDVLRDAERSVAQHLQASVAASSVFENLKGRTLQRHDLPILAQVAPVQALLIGDYNRDSNLDIITAGNLFGMRAAVGRQDAGRGRLLLGDGAMGFTIVPGAGLQAAQDVRELRQIDSRGQDLILVASSDGHLEVYRWVR